MKRKIIILAMALLVSILALAGCTAAPQSDGQYGSSGRHGYETLPDDDSTLRGGYGRQNAAVPDAAQENGIIIEENELPTPSVSDSVAASADLNTSVDLAGYGSVGALLDSDLTLADMLTYALQDEYLARAEYVAIIDAFGNVRPFTNIIRAEENHISQLLPLFESYNIAPPDSDASSHVVNAADVAQAYSAGETAEVNNIAMYDAFLKQDLPDDVRAVFESLKGASENHLAAFRKHL